MLYIVIFFFKQKTAYEMRISDWSSDVCSSDLLRNPDAREWRQCLPRERRNIPRARRQSSHQVPNRCRPAPFRHATMSEKKRERRGRRRRSEERREGKECVSTCRSRLQRFHYKKHINKKTEYYYTL